MESHFRERAAVAEDQEDHEGSSQNNSKNSNSSNSNPSNSSSSNSRSTSTATWQEIKVKVPGYQWAQVEGDYKRKLKVDNAAKIYKVGKRSHSHVVASDKKASIALDFPLHLWNEVGSWWQKLSWSPISSIRGQGHSRQVTWLELLVDFELYTGTRCCDASASPLPTWGERASLLHKVVNKVLRVRGDGLKDLRINYGFSYAVSTLAPFGEARLKGLLRRPRFASGDATNRAVAKSCWEWANSETSSLSSL